MRKLASIQTVKSLAPIPGADKIEVATVLDWHLVVKKGEFKVGDACVYFEIDSILPELPVFEFMRERKFRVKTVKLRSQISQGLAVPVSSFPEVSDMPIDADVTELLGVKKYDPEAEEEQKLIQYDPPKSNVVKYLMRYGWFRNAYAKIRPKSGKFPSAISKTDETRVQAIGSIVRANAGRSDLYVTEKIDGSSMTVIKENKKLFGIIPTTTFLICSRNLALPKPDGSNFWKYVDRTNLFDRLGRCARPVAIQGELAGPGIQKNKYGFADTRFFMFRAKWLDTGAYATFQEMRELALLCDIEVVPVIQHKYELPADVDVLVELSKGNSIFAARPREGVVIRTYDQSLSFKSINPEFLLKE